MTLNIYCVVSKLLECLYKILYVNNNDKRLITPERTAAKCLFICQNLSLTLSLYLTPHHLCRFLLHHLTLLLS